MAQSPSSPGERGILGSLEALGATFLALLRTRAELAVVELREEGERRKQFVLLGAVAAVFLTLAALLLAFLVVALFWDQRLAALAAVTAVYLGVGLYALARLRRLMRESPPPFEATLAELDKDMEALRGRHE